MKMTVFLFGCFAASQMTFFLVEIQYFFYLFVKARIDFFEILRNVFMYGALTDSEMFGNRTNRCFMFDQIIGQYDASFGSEC